MAMVVSSHDPSGSLLSCGTHFRQSLSFGPVLLPCLWTNGSSPAWSTMCCLGILTGFIWFSENRLGWSEYIYILYYIYIYYILYIYYIYYIYYIIYISFLCGCLIETSIVTLQHESWWVSHALPTSTGNQRWSMVDSTAAWWFVASVREEGNHFQKSQAVRYCHQHRDVATFLTFICSIAIKNWPFGWNPIGVQSPSPFFRYPLKRRYGKIHQTI